MWQDLAHAAVFRVEWWDRAEGALPNPDVQYPEPERAGALLCSDRRLFRYNFLAGQDQQLGWTAFGGQAQMRVLLRLIWNRPTTFASYLYADAHTNRRGLFICLRPNSVQARRWPDINHLERR
jgi:hypothetical protein